MSELLTKDIIEGRLFTLEGWRLKSAPGGVNEIEKPYSFEDFREAMRFVNKVAELADKADHHPDILINYNKVTLTLSTHSAGGLTEKDLDLARDIEFL